MFTKKITTFFFALAFHTVAFATPTERHIQEHSFDAIMKDSEDNVQDASTDLLIIAAQENEDTFFGYHGISYKSRLFQDVLRALFETHSSIDIPEDFYFLRTPLDRKWTWSNGKHSFLKRFATSLTDEHKNLATKDLLTWCNNKFKTKLSLNHFSKKELSAFSTFFELYLERSKAEEYNYSAKKYPVADQIKMLLPSIDEAMANVINLMVTKVKNLYPKMDVNPVRAWLEEDLDDEFYIYDVLCLRNLDLKKNDKDYHQLFARLQVPYDDTDDIQQSILISLNISLFGNFMTSGCYTPEIFCNNESILEGDKKLASQLSKWFKKIGLDPNAVHLMWEEGEKILLNEGITRGCLLQFFDNSVNKGKKPFEFLDNNAYVSMKRGIPVFAFEPSTIVSGGFFESDRRDFELRLVANDKTILNPLSVLRMVRHDDLPAEAAREIIDNMKKHLKHAVIDSSKLKKYMRRVETVWKKAIEDKKSKVGKNTKKSKKKPKIG